MTNAIPTAITSWLKRTYPKPHIDQVWLGECYKWMVDDEQISPHDTQNLTRVLETALLDSDLKDSMQPVTGFPEDIACANNLAVQGSILVQIVDVTEIGHSAFSLTNVRQARLDQEDLAGLAQNEEENGNQDQADEDAGPIPKYPRSMLKLHLSDGSVTVPAIEFKKIPELELGVTTLGCKLLLKDFTVYGGTIFLDPNCVVIKRGVEEKPTIQDELFLAGLRKRMGLPAEESPELAVYREAHLKLPSVGRGRSQPGPTNPTNNGNATRKRKAPTKNPPSGDTTAAKSRFFTKPKPEITASQLIKNGVFSPLTRTTTVIDIESDEEKSRSLTGVSTRAKKQDISITRTETEYSFEGDEIMDNPDFFRELERVESAVLSQQSAPSISGGPSQARFSQRPLVAYSDTIEVDTDKENESGSKRRVRRKVLTKKAAAAANQTVISIGDSD